MLQSAGRVVRSISRHDMFMCPFSAFNVNVAARKWLATEGYRPTAWVARPGQLAGSLIASVASQASWSRSGVPETTAALTIYPSQSHILEVRGREVEPLTSGIATSI